MKDFEKWFEIYSKTIMKLQNQKITSAESRIDKLNEEFIKVEKVKSDKIDGISKEKILSDLGSKLRKESDTVRKHKKSLVSYMSTDAEMILSNLEKHSFFTGLIADNVTGELNLYTKTIKYSRNNIGRFRIVLHSSEHSFIKVVNLDYNHNGYDKEHWAISQFQPCYGEWQDEISRLSIEGNIFEIFQMMILYISTSGHDHAYMKREDYFEGREKLSKEDSEKKEFARFIDLSTNPRMILNMTMIIDDIDPDTKNIRNRINQLEKVYREVNYEKKDHPKKIPPSLDQIVSF